MQVAGTVLPWFNVPPAILRGLVIALVLSFVPALAFAWVFELTPDGLRRDAEVLPDQSNAPRLARRMDRLIIIVLVGALAYFAVDKFVLTPQRATVMVPAATSWSATDPPPYCPSST